MIRIIKSLVNKEETSYVAVSMGVDSLAVVHWMLSKSYKVVALHFNHKMREQNEEMERKFKSFCEEFNVKNFCGCGSGLKTENECRNARIEFYSNAVKEKAAKVVTAHHINDWVEGYLLNCFRGKQENDPIPLISNFSKYKIVHPFLLSRKKDFEQYIDRNNLRRYAVRDETNSFIKGSRRNWVRERIIPEMNKNQVSLEKFAKRKIGTLAQGLERKTHNLLVGGSIPSRPISIGD